MKRLLFPARNNRGGVDTLIITIYIIPFLLFTSIGAFAPTFAYIMKMNHLNRVIDQGLKETEDVGYASPAILTNLKNRLTSLGMAPITTSGTTYPDFTGSTNSKVLRDDPDPTVRLVIKYPAPNILRYLRVIGGGGSANTTEGFYYLVLEGRSESYE